MSRMNRERKVLFKKNLLSKSIHRNIAIEWEQRKRKYLPKSRTGWRK